MKVFPTELRPGSFLVLHKETCESIRFRIVLETDLGDNGGLVLTIWRKRVNVGCVHHIIEGLIVKGKTPRPIAQNITRCLAYHCRHEIQVCILMIVKKFGAFGCR